MSYFSTNELYIYKGYLVKVVHIKHAFLYIKYKYIYNKNRNLAIIT